MRTFSCCHHAISAAAIGLSLLLAAPAGAATTAWSHGVFNIDVQNVVRRSNIILGRPNTSPDDSMPLGNGSLGAAVWAANGFTAQINRDDTFPDRKAAGQVIIPGLAALTSAADFQAHLDLYSGMLVESGGGMRATIYVRATTDELVVDVTGANPSTAQTVRALLWPGRLPNAAASGPAAMLAETWRDTEPGGTGTPFGTLLAITAGGRHVTSSVVDPATVQLQFLPNADGSFRVVIGAPTWRGGNAKTTVSKLLGGDATAPSSTLEASHLSWWRSYWAGANLLKMSSADESAQYLENLRTLYLYQEASLNRGAYPGTQAGVADLFAFTEDHHDWAPANYWFWNLRMQVAANLGSGVPRLNASFFNLYTSHLADIEAWTRAHVPGSAGACVPETMRYNGSGYYAGNHAASNASCDTTIPPSYNSQTLTTGAELSIWIWRQYLATDSIAFLRAGYPLMKASAQFLLSQARLGPDGFLHTTANAHETQWHVTDPVTDVAAMRALFPIVTSAAQRLGTDRSFVTHLAAVERQIPPLPRTDASTHSEVLTPGADSLAHDVIAFSTEPTAPLRNIENLDLEPVWPYGIIGDDSKLTPLAIRTYRNRLNEDAADWSYDAIRAARLGMPNQVRSQLMANVMTYQVYPDGMASDDETQGDEPYNEELGVVASALNEALVQDYDGMLRVAPAWPSDWDVQGSVSIQDNGKVDVEYLEGALITVVVEAGASVPQTIRSPWAGKLVKAIDATTGTTVMSATSARTFSIAMDARHKYLIEQAAAPFTSLSYAQVSGTPASAAKHLEDVRIGLDSYEMAGGKKP